MRRSARRWAGHVRNVALLVATSGMASACSWFTAFVEQPKLDPWEVVGNIRTPSRGQPQNSVPITGTTVAAYQVSYTPLPGVVDSMSAIRNATAPSEASVANGRKLFQINCAVCHGMAGKGNGPVAKYGIIAPNLTADHAKGVTDGYIFGMMRNGRGAMPTYDRLEDMERWDIVNYIRGLQGKLDMKVDSGPVGYPGQTGDALPGFSVTAPTRPVPYYRGRPFLLDTTSVIRAQTPGPSAPVRPAAKATQ